LRLLEQPMSDKPAPPRARWLTATVLGIGLASLCSDAGHEMATTAMPALLAMIGAGPAALGLIEGLADGSSSFVKLLSGHYSDRLRRRKPLAVAGYFVTAAGMASFALATVWWHVLLGRVFGWIGRGARSPVRKVLLTEATTPETYGRAFGFERAMDTAGAVIGPLLAIGLTAAVGLRWVFALTILPGIAAALAITFLVREREHAPKSHANLRSGLQSLPSGYWKYLAGVGIAGLGDYSKLLLVLWATTAFREWMASEEAVLLGMAYYVGYNLVYMLSCSASGMLADHWPKNGVLAGGYALAVVPAIALLLPLNPFVRFGLAFGFAGLYMGVWETVESTTAATLLSKEIRGTGFGLLDTVNGIGDFFSSLIVGFVWQSVSPAAAMGFVMMTSLAGAVVIGSLRSE
jgi:predicted MFS family arabinose efflux permease